jgi:hypothetical protein
MLPTLELAHLLFLLQLRAIHPTGMLRSRKSKFQPSEPGGDTRFVGSLPALQVYFQYCCAVAENVSGVEAVVRKSIADLITEVQVDDNHGSVQTQ